MTRTELGQMLTDSVAENCREQGYPLTSDEWVRIRLEVQAAIEAAAYRQRKGEQVPA